MTLQHSEEEISRRKKLAEIINAGINPYPSQSKRTHSNAQALADFDSLAEKNSEITLVGRLRLLRPHGKLTFAQIEDESSAIQIYFQFDVLGETKYNLLKLLDIADFIQATGTLFTTKKGEKTLKVTDFIVLCKSLKPLPEKWHGLKDRETRYRKRYLDLIMNQDSRELFRKRSLFVKNIRSFLEERGFMEVETPVLEHIPGGAEAEPFVTHHNTLDLDLYMRISLELHHKRLIVGGFEKIYEIGKVFRNEGMSTQHLQEFTEMEFYWAYADWEDLMKLTEEMFREVLQKTFGTLQFTYKDTAIDFSQSWPRLNYVSLIKEKTGIDIEQYPDAESLQKAINEKGLKLDDPDVGRGRLIDQFYKKFVRPSIVAPSFLVNHPVDVSPLSKIDPAHPQRTQRFQLLVAGNEACNAFSELNDPIDQRKRFEAQAKLREAGDTEAYMFDEDFVNAIEHGMPPTAGFGMGVDRLFALLTNQESIRDVVFFPTMKPHVESSSDNSDTSGE